eukprot:TRINITY_DN3421_c0_g1_i2.p1 TRINITY_DN3421_c0_g1~~TRINITY_DN3421_c0_g1_i2.p1  ORF type:complete len:176 (+),score=47.83 TRINITY_DN3421_c0_g1_i2:161-688(+)
MADVKDVVEFVNERKRAVENLTKISDIKDTVTKVPDAFFRNLTHSFIDATDLKTKNKQDKTQLRHLILFNDVLLICEIKKSSRRTGGKTEEKEYKMKQILEFSECSVEQVPADNSIILSGGRDKWVIFFEVPYMCNMWYKNLESFCANSVAKIPEEDQKGKKSKKKERRGSANNK